MIDILSLMRLVDSYFTSSLVTSSNQSSVVLFGEEVDDIISTFIPIGDKELIPVYPGLPEDVNAERRIPFYPKKKGGLPPVFPEILDPPKKKDPLEDAPASDPHRNVEPGPRPRTPKSEDVDS